MTRPTTESDARTPASSTAPGYSRTDGRRPGVPTIPCIPGVCPPTRVRSERRVPCNARGDHERAAVPPGTRPPHSVSKISFIDFMLFWK